MKKTTSRTFTKLSLAVAATLLAAGANAASVTWNFENTAGLPGHSFIETSGGVSITMRAYSTTSSNNTSTWSQAQFNNQGSAGLGMTHTGESTSAPNHAIDSLNGVTDIVVIDAGAGNTIDWTSLAIGYGWDGADNNRADIKLWTGNTALNFGTVTLNGLTGLGFSSSTLNNVAENSSTATNTSPSRYLIMSGNVDDAFKLKTIGGTTGIPPGQVPEPASIALLGLGLLGFAFARRRKV